jgi:DNA helicase-2/ATP-dependent DNA helicase PcrA
MANKLIIAGAGSGKTTQLIQESLKIKDEQILISTYTEANANEIKNKFIKENGCVPPNITILTWFSLLIKHGVKPYQSVLFEDKVKGMILVSQQSAFRFKTKQGFPIYWGEKDFHKHYFTKETKIYSDKLSKLVCKINAKSEGKVIDRLVSIFPTVFIDECQDLAGYDLDILKLFSTNTKNLILVCDPRQVTYLTHNESKYKKYRNGLIEDFLRIECKKIDFNIDVKTLSHSYRCNQLICNYSNKLYSEIIPCDSKQNEVTEHDGVFLVDKKDITRYLEKFLPIQLRWNISNRSVNLNFEVYNFGQSKGLTFNRVLIYPTEKMLDWMQDHKNELNIETRAKFYVGITRARFSVGIVCDTNLDYIMEGITKFK